MQYSSETTGKLSDALAKAQGKIKNAPLNKTNPHFRSKYADLASIRDAAIGPLAEHGIAVTQTTGTDENGQFVLFTRLSHSSGEWMVGAYPLPVDVGKPQQMGSAITYARRYTLAAMVGIASEEDDDGNAAQDSSAQQTRKATAKQGSNGKQEAVTVTPPDEPGLIPVPSSDNMSTVWRKWAEALANCIAQAGDVTEINTWMRENNTPLGSLRAFSDTGQKWADSLEDRAEKKRHELAQAPHNTEEAA